MSENTNKTKGEIKQDEKNLSGFYLPAYQVVFLRKVLGTERLPKDDAQVRNHFVFNILVPVLNKIDLKIAEIRDKYATRLPNGQVKVNPETGIDYGENSEVSFRAFDDLMKEKVFIHIEDMSLFGHIFGIFFNTNYPMGEEDTTIYNEIVEVLKAVENPKK